MYLLYVDESGSANDPNLDVFVLAGVAVFERQTHWIGTALDNLAAQVNATDPDSVEFHGSEMRGNKGCWKGIAVAERRRILGLALDVVALSHPSTRLFCAVVRRSQLQPGVDPVRLAFEHLVRRFDMFLLRLHRQDDTQRGLIVMDRTHYEQTLQLMTRDFKRTGHSLGILRNLAEVPVCMDSRSSRLVQAADLVAYAAFRNFQAGESEWLSRIQHRLDVFAGTVVGLAMLPEVS